MRRFPLQEFFLLCVPIVALGGSLFATQLLHPPRDPNAKIELSLSALQARSVPSPLNPQVNFGWKARVSGGPQSGYHIGYYEEIVARTRTSTTVIYSSSPHVKTQRSYSTSGGAHERPGSSFEIEHNVQVDEGDVMPGAKFEWRGEVVAIPLESGTVTSAASPDQLAKWAMMPGAAHTKKSFPISVGDVSRNAKVKLDQVNAVNASHGSDTCISILVRDVPYYDCRRLVAFDGKKTRLLWKDNQPTPNRLWKSEQTSSVHPIRNEFLLFQLRDVPASWGQILFLYDIAYLDSQHRPDLPHKDLATIERAAKMGGTRITKRLVVRRIGETIKAVPLSNEVVLHPETFQAIRFAQPDADGYDVEFRLRMRYSGKESQPTISVPSFELRDEKRRPITTTKFNDVATKTTGGLYTVSHWGKLSEIGNIKRVRVIAQVTDGKTKLQRIDAVGSVSQEQHSGK